LSLTLMSTGRLYMCHVTGAWHESLTVFLFGRWSLGLTISEAKVLLVEHQ